MRSYPQLVKKDRLTEIAPRKPLASAMGKSGAISVSKFFCPGAPGGFAVPDPKGFGWNGIRMLPAMVRVAIAKGVPDAGCI